jgi:stearoyl-CoA desaturase (delta-9 desaturase)
MSVTAPLAPSSLGAAPPPPPPPSTRGGHEPEQVLTAALVVVPLALTIWALSHVWSSPPSVLDLGLALGMYALTGYGVTVGFHRLFTHRSFRAVRWLRITLAICGSMAFQGPLVGWVADHRRHHAFTDRPGDPHSPHLERGALRRARGPLHAHVGWLFRHDPTDPQRYARDVRNDPDLRRISDLFPLWCVVSLGIPFGLGWAIGGSLHNAWTALLWAGLVRVALLHQVTWCINSLCHLVGARPHATGDRSTNIAPLAVLSMGESFHNNHHAHPSSARHGTDPGQRDSSAALIALFARAGWASHVHLAAPSGAPRHAADEDLDRRLASEA